MKKILHFLNLQFVPASSDVGLLLLRVGLGASMLWLHGWGKMMNYSANSEKFLDLLGIGSKASLTLAIFAEVFCSALLIVGFLTRFAALNLAITMGVAFFMVHKGALSGPGNGEMAFVYLLGYVTLLAAGAGRYSLDRTGKGN